MNKIINENINLRAENKRLKQQRKDLKNSNLFHRFNSKNQEECIDYYCNITVQKDKKVDNLIDLYDINKKEYLAKLKENKDIYLTELKSLNEALNDYKEKYEEVWNILNSKDREDIRICKFKKLIKDICDSNSNLLYDLKRPVWVEPQTREIRNWEDILHDPYIGSEVVTLRNFSIFDLIQERL